MNPHQTYNFHNMGSPPPPMSIHPGPASSPSQSVPGRRTPLGTVGLGGFYAQGNFFKFNEFIRVNLRTHFRTFWWWHDSCSYRRKSTWWKYYIKVIPRLFKIRKETF